MYILSIKDNRVVVTDWLERVTLLASVAEFDNFMQAEATRLNRSVDELRVYNSSTMDFPHDSTDDPAVIALAEALR